MGVTKVPWTQMSWNISTGCTKVSAGCKLCWAKHIHDFRHDAYKNGKKLPFQYSVPFEYFLIHENRLFQPNRWKKPKLVFVNSTSDLFHEQMDTEWLINIFHVMQQNPQHIFQILTKRPKRMADFIKEFYTNDHISVPENVWLGVSVENQATYLERGSILKSIPAGFKWLSIEPLLSQVTLNCNYQHENKTVTELRAADWNWVVIGAESGVGRRYCHNDLIQNIVTECKSITDNSYQPPKDLSIPVFVKQIHFKLHPEKIYVERNWIHFPTDMAYQEFPEVVYRRFDV